MKWKTFAQRIFTEPSGNPSNKRLIATYAVLVYSIILLFGFFYAFQINDAVLHMADMLLATSLGNYLAGRFAEKSPYVPTVESEDSTTKSTQVAPKAKPSEEKTDGDSEEK